MQQQQQRVEPVQDLPELELPGPLAKALSKYNDAWAAIPSRYKIVLAGSLSFVICNMVSCPRTLVVCGAWCVG